MGQRLSKRETQVRVIRARSGQFEGCLCWSRSAEDMTYHFFYTREEALAWKAKTDETGDPSTYEPRDKRPWPVWAKRIMREHLRMLGVREEFLPFGDTAQEWQ